MVWLSHWLPHLNKGIYGVEAIYNQQVSDAEFPSSQIDQDFPPKFKNSCLRLWIHPSECGAWIHFGSFKITDFFSGAPTWKNL